MSRRAGLVVATSAALLSSLFGGVTVLLHSGPSAQRPTALQPVPAKAPEPEPSTATPEPDPGALLNQGGSPSGGSSAALLPAPSLPVFQFPAPPQLPAVPTIDWQAALEPYIQSQMNAAAANLAGSINGTASGAANSAAVAVSDLLLFANYANNNPALLSQLESALPAAAPAVAALQSGAGPDFSGLSAAFAAAAAQPPLGIPAPPGLPQLPPPPGLPTPEQVAAALAIPAVGLPALAVPTLPPPPPIGLPF